MLNIKTLQDIMRTDAGVDGDAQRIGQIIWILFLKVYDFYEKRWRDSAEFEGEIYTSIIPDELSWDTWANQYDANGNVRKDIKTGDELIDFVNNKLFPTLKNLYITNDMPLNKKIVKKAFEDRINFMKDGIQLRKLINAINSITLDENSDRALLSSTYETFLKDLQSAGNAGEYYTPRAVTDFIMEILRPKIGDKIADLACGTGGFLTSAFNYLNKLTKNTRDSEILKESFYGVEKKPLPYILCVTNFLIKGIENPNLDHANSFDTHFDDIKPSFDIIAMNPPYGGSENDTIKSNFPSEFRSSETADLFMAMITESLKFDGKAAVVLPDGFLFGDDSAKINLKKRLLDEFNLHLIVRLPKSVFAPYTSITTNILFFERNGTGTDETWFYRLDMPPAYKAFSKTKPMKLEHFDEFFAWDTNRTALNDENGNPKAAKFSKAQLIDKNYNLDLCGFIEAKDEILPPFELIEKFTHEQNELKSQMSATLEAIEAILKSNKAQ
ncbi:type I restriction-modification system subunit M [Campylobacter sp. JMF_06 NA1]|uniref:class I SAM-dependent DNA methyltransferase n=1 Tax=Campylobacter sp. JMF_06 NA1 TaxID=2983823 RepID=UPI0022E9AECD|nr:N-6 DNA methylase [Campylobacter sp. JMF_06 NA1]MDA3077574.1 type I restriction-modification system subunit M [Campylobacter sp. JMF_06 NA1]